MKLTMTAQYMVVRILVKQLTPMVITINEIVAAFAFVPNERGIILVSSAR
jgi:hypothetical protein